MNSNIGINMKEMYQQTKQRMNLESRQIKKMMLYNYINDPIDSALQHKTRGISTSLIVTE